jgi:molecular chaperone HtpG
MSTTTTTSETFAFQAEINQLMSLIVNAFYSNKDIFLRELISNSSDAIDKARHKELTENKNADNKEYHIRVSANKEAKTLTVEDNGIGLTRDEMIQYLGTIANSGTKQFSANRSTTAGDGAAAAEDLIGQFGVGFYSAYLVADKVQVFSGNHCWESQASGSFTITEEEECGGGGVKVVLFVKDTCHEYFEEEKLRSIVRAHSEFIQHPIYLQTVTKKLVETETLEEETPEEETETIEEKPTSAVEPPVVYEETVLEWTHLNTQKPIWLRKPDEVSKEEHEAFYKSISGDNDTYADVKHFSAEGQVEYKTVMYVPKRAPFDMFGKNDTKKSKMKLYVNRVLISEKTEDMLLPEWLGFVTGVVDSNDLPLNVSREMLQQNRVMNVIKKNLVKKCIDMFQNMEPETYDAFYEQFHQSLKLGVHEDDANRDKLVKLLRFECSHLEAGKRISFEEYFLGNTEEETGNQIIYYITGESRKALEHSPFLHKHGRVLFMVDPIDEYVLQRVHEFNGKKLVNVSKSSKDFVDNTEEHNAVCKAFQDTLGEHVEKVVVSVRLSDDVPCVLVSTEYGWSANMERILKAQALAQKGASSFQAQKKILEINPNNRLVKTIHDAVLNNNLSERVVKDTIRLMYDTAMIASGYTQEDPVLFTKRVFNMMHAGLVGSGAEEEEETVEVETDSENNNNNMESLD